MTLFLITIIFAATPDAASDDADRVVGRVLVADAAAPASTPASAAPGLESVPELHGQQAGPGKAHQPP